MLRAALSITLIFTLIAGPVSGQHVVYAGDQNTVQQPRAIGSPWYETKRIFYKGKSLSSEMPDDLEKCGIETYLEPSAAGVQDPRCKGEGNSSVLKTHDQVVRVAEDVLAPELASQLARRVFEAYAASLLVDQQFMTDRTSCYNQEATFLEVRNRLVRDAEDSGRDELRESYGKKDETAMGGAVGLRVDPSYCTMKLGLTPDMIELADMIHKAKCAGVPQVPSRLPGTITRLPASLPTPAPALAAAHQAAGMTAAGDVPSEDAGSPSCSSGPLNPWNSELQNPAQQMYNSALQLAEIEHVRTQVEKQEEEAKKLLAKRMPEVKSRLLISPEQYCDSPDMRDFSGGTGECVAFLTKYGKCMQSGQAVHCMPEVAKHRFFGSSTAARFANDYSAKGFTYAAKGEEVKKLRDEIMGPVEEAKKVLDEAENELVSEHPELLQKVDPPQPGKGRDKDKKQMAWRILAECKTDCDKLSHSVFDRAMRKSRRQKAATIFNRICNHEVELTRELMGQNPALVQSFLDEKGDAQKKVLACYLKNNVTIHEDLTEKAEMAETGLMIALTVASTIPSFGASASAIWLRGATMTHNRAARLGKIAMEATTKSSRARAARLIAGKGRMLTAEGVGLIGWGLLGRTVHHGRDQIAKRSELTNACLVDYQRLLQLENEYAHTMRNIMIGMAGAYVGGWGFKYVKTHVGRTAAAQKVAKALEPLKETREAVTHPISTAKTRIAKWFKSQVAKRKQIAEYAATLEDMKNLEANPGALLGQAGGATRTASDDIARTAVPGQAQLPLKISAKPTTSAGRAPAAVQPKPVAAVAEPAVAKNTTQQQLSLRGADVPSPKRIALNRVGAKKLTERFKGFEVEVLQPPTGRELRLAPKLKFDEGRMNLVRSHGISPGTISKKVFKTDGELRDFIRKSTPSKLRWEKTVRADGTEVYTANVTFRVKTPDGSAVGFEGLVPADEAKLLFPARTPVPGPRFPGGTKEVVNGKTVYRYKELKFDHKTGKAVEVQNSTGKIQIEEIPTIAIDEAEAKQLGTQYITVTYEAPVTAAQRELRGEVKRVMAGRQGHFVNSRVEIDGKVITDTLGNQPTGYVMLNPQMNGKTVLDDAIEVMDDMLTDALSARGEGALNRKVSVHATEGGTIYDAVNQERSSVGDAVESSSRN